MCFVCANRTDGNDNGEATCTAFPDGIPTEIIRGGFDHRNAAPDDNGIRFKPDPVDSPAKVQAVLQQYDTHEYGTGAVPSIA